MIIITYIYLLLAVTGVNGFGWGISIEGAYGYGVGLNVAWPLPESGGIPNQYIAQVSYLIYIYWIILLSTHLVLKFSQTSS